MSYIACFDLGTTSIKGILVHQHGSLCGKVSYDLETIHGPQGEREQNPEDWWQGLLAITNYWWKEFSISAAEIKLITFCGQMQDVIMIPHEGKPTPKAILYSDARAGAEAELINERLSNLTEITGNHLDGASPLAKLLWLQQHQPQTYAETLSFVFSAKDYLVYQLTNALVTDPVTGATTGLMNIETRAWHEEWMEVLGLSTGKLPELCHPDQVVGSVNASAAKLTGFVEGTPVLCGSGDAGATTMGAGAIQEGDAYIYMGTTGWIALPSFKVSKQHYGVFHLAHLPRDRYITIAPLLNVGNVHSWGAETFTDRQADNQFAAFESLAQAGVPGANGLLFLPYLHGERFPVTDPKARGVYFGIHPFTKREDMARALLEGLCFSFRQTFELLIAEQREMVTLIGGGAKSGVWCQTLANVLGKRIRIPQDSEYLPALGAAASAFVHLEWVEDYEQFVQQMLISTEDKLYEPELALTEMYTEQYKRFVTLYPAIKELSR